MVIPHGNAEQHRSRRARGIDENGAEYCAAPTEDFLPECWRAGQIILDRCILAGESSEVCERCSVRFSDEDYTSNARDAVYYVRAIEEASPTINADQLRCELDDEGQCIAVNPCRATLLTDPADDCLASAEERAWSSPIYVDWLSTGQSR
jgi:hypothetical protein